MIKKTAFLALISVLTACGGGGGSSGSSGGNASPPVLFADSVAGQCAAPRANSVLNPSTGLAYGDRQGSLTSEKLWIRRFVDETYLWYDEVVAQDPALFTVGAAAFFVEPSDNSRRAVTLGTNREVLTTYFNGLRSLQVTPSSRPKDRFHFTIPTDVYTAQSTTGVATGFGFEVALLASTPPRKALVAYTDPGTAAASNGIGRGAEFVSVNGVSVANGSPTVLNEGLFSPTSGSTYTFEIRDQGSLTTRTVAMTAAAVTAVPVQNVRTLAAPNSSVGYLLFNDHIATAEAQLVAAVVQLKAANNGAGISDLVLDMRYNGGGLLSIASELAYMVAGSGKTTGQFFEKLTFNSKNPFGLTEAEKTTPFYAAAQGFSSPKGQLLPQLGLSRVFVLTGAGTCSASESVMNGLAGVGVQVIQIGATTCGKPYGFLPQDNCGETYFTVQFKGVNQRGYGDYSDGFVPGSTGSQFAGCVVADDFSKNLGDPAEARLASALQFRATGTCAPAVAAAADTAAFVSTAEPVLQRSVMRSNRWLSLPSALR